jgi:hypothetical protein
LQTKPQVPLQVAAPLAGALQLTQPAPQWPGSVLPAQLVPQA